MDELNFFAHVWRSSGIQWAAAGFYEKVALFTFLCYTSLN